MLPSLQVFYRRYIKRDLEPVHLPRLSRTHVLSHHVRKDMVTALHPHYRIVITQDSKQDILPTSSSQRRPRGGNANTSFPSPTRSHPPRRPAATACLSVEPVPHDHIRSDPSLRHPSATPGKSRWDVGFGRLGCRKRDAPVPGQPSWCDSPSGVCPSQDPRLRYPPSASFLEWPVLTNFEGYSPSDPICPSP